MTLVQLKPAEGVVQRGPDAKDAFVVRGELFGEPVSTGMGGAWTEQERAMREPVLVYNGRQLISGALDVILENDDFGSVAEKVRWMRRYARGSEGDTRDVPTTLKVDAQGAWDLDVKRYPTWLWVIRDIAEQDDELLEYGPNGVRRQRFTVTLSRFQSANPIFLRKGKPLTDAARVKATTRVTAKDVEFGLVYVSVRLYGTSARVRDLMRLNRITDPKKLKLGQEIKLP